MEPSSTDAVRALRAYAQGHLLLTGEERRSVRFVWDRRGGRLVFPVPGEFEAEEGQLLVPDEHGPSVAALLSLERPDPMPGILEIRYEIYHGRPREAGWVLASIEALRHHGEPYDSEQLELTDALAGDEPALCRELNADRSRLRRLCEAVAKARVEEPVAVGVDPDGIDIRARFGIVRLAFAGRAESAEGVWEQLDRLSEASRA